MRVLVMRRQLGRRHLLAIQAFPAKFLLSGAVQRGLFARQAMRNATRRSGPSVRRAHRASLPIRFPTTPVQLLAGVTPNPIDGIAGCRILLGVQARWRLQEHGDTIGTGRLFPAALRTLSNSS